MKTSESPSRNDDALKQAIAILEEANLFSWHVSKEEVWVGWQNCPTSASPLKKALDLLRSVVPSETGPMAEIAAERRRQIEKEGWSVEHDDEHDAGTMACAGAAYALNAGCVLYPLNGTAMEKPPEFWMWGEEWWKPKDPRRDLIRAAALIVAELERMDREKARGK